MSPTRSIEIDEDVPEWVEDFLARALGAQVQIINWVVVRNDRRRLRVLVNTTEGSALLEKHRAGEPRLVRLQLPGDRFSTHCIRCNEWIELHDPQTPRSFHCTRCAKRYMLTHDDDTFVLLTDIRDTAWRPGADEPHRNGHPLWERVDKVGSPPKPAKDPAAPRLIKEAEPAPAPQAPKVERRTSHFEVNGYRLYTKQTTLKGGRQQRIYFFSKDTNRAEKAILKPRGYKVVVTARTGLPVLRRAKPGENEDEIEVRKAQKTYRPQCLALTHDDKQCRNSARDGSKYCGSHKSYRPGDEAAAHKQGADTKPRVKRAKDTEPAYRHADKKRKGATKKRVAKKRSVKKATKRATKKAATKKRTAKNATGKKAGKRATKKTATKKRTATKATGKKATKRATKKAATKKRTAKNATGKKAGKRSAKKTATTKRTAKKATGKKAAKRTAKRSSAKPPAPSSATTTRTTTRDISWTVRKVNR